MIALGYFLIATGGALHLILQFFYFLMVIRVVLSWVNPDPRNMIVQFIYNATEPLLVKVRDKIPPLGMLDLSPLLWFLILYFLDMFLVSSLMGYGHHFLAESGTQPVL